MKGVILLNLLLTAVGEATKGASFLLSLLRAPLNSYLFLNENSTR